MVLLVLRYFVKCDEVTLGIRNAAIGNWTTNPTKYSNLI